MTGDVDHSRCIGGCLLAATPSAIANRARRHKFDPDQLEELLRLVSGRCMLCCSCHAMVIDLTTRAAQRKPRGILCRWCKQRVATYEGSYGPDAPLDPVCRCGSPRDPERAARMSAATAQYLRRVAPHATYRESRDWFDALIDEVARNGLDPARVWGGAPVSGLPELPAREIDPRTDYDYDSRVPLDRARCGDNCRDHDQHLYIACFPEPTTLRDADTLEAVAHYVGWTRQLPIRRVEQHGPACRESLVAIIPGTLAEEELLKAVGLCPNCGRPLRYK